MTSVQLPFRVIFPSAIRCFVHVYEEWIGRYGLQVQRHYLVMPSHGPVSMTACDYTPTPDATIVVMRVIQLDHSWCRTCAGRLRQDMPHRGGVLQEMPWRL